MADWFVLPKFVIVDYIDLIKFKSTIRLNMCALTLWTGFYMEYPRTYCFPDITKFNYPALMLYLLSLSGSAW